MIRYSLHNQEEDTPLVMKNHISQITTPTTSTEQYSFHENFQYPNCTVDALCPRWIHDFHPRGLVARLLALSDIPK